MKKLAIITSIGAALIGSMFIFMSFTSSSKNTEGLLYVRVTECFSAINPSSIIITDGAAVIKVVELGTLRLKDQSGNLQKITAEFNELKKQGYVLISSNSVSTTESIMMTNFIFEKK
jgi:hypothetical protein